MFERVIWPAEYDPSVSAIFALNEIDVAAPADVVWDLLVDARGWSRWFPVENQVNLLGGAERLGPTTHFTRVTVGFPMSLTITEFEPATRLAWATTVDGDVTGSSAYHGWVITPTAAGCHVLSEETQQGEFFLEELGRKNPGGLHRYHQDWVERLAHAAELQAGS